MYYQVVYNFVIKHYIYGLEIFSKHDLFWGVDCYSNYNNIEL